MYIYFSLITVSDYFYLFNFFLPLYGAYRILVPWPGIEYMTPVVEVQSLNHWTTKEVPNQWLFLKEGKTWEGKEIEESEEEKSQGDTELMGLEYACMCVCVCGCVN